MVCPYKMNIYFWGENGNVMKLVMNWDLCIKGIIKFSELMENINSLILEKNFDILAKLFLYSLNHSSTCDSVSGDG